LFRSGDVVVGDKATGIVLGIKAFGGSTVGDNKAGNGGQVSIFGDHISVTQIDARGGDTTSMTAANAGDGGSITLTSAVIEGAAVLLYGEGDAPDSTEPSTGTLITRGGKIAAVVGNGASSPFVLNTAPTRRWRAPAARSPFKAAR